MPDRPDTTDDRVALKPERALAQALTKAAGELREILWMADIAHRLAMQSSLVDRTGDEDQDAENSLALFAIGHVQEMAKALADKWAAGSKSGGALSDLPRGALRNSLLNNLGMMKSNDEEERR